MISLILNNEIALLVWESLLVIIILINASFNRNNRELLFPGYFKPYCPVSIESLSVPVRHCESVM